MYVSVIEWSLFLKGEILVEKYCKADMLAFQMSLSQIMIGS